MEKYGNKSPLMKIVNKNAGYITVGIILAVAVPLYFLYDSSLDFFEKWSCPMMETYQKGMATAGDNPPYKDLDDLTKERFDLILRDEC